MSYPRGSAATNQELVREVLRANCGITILSSSRAAEVSLESPDHAHGTFTTAGHELGEIELPGESELFTYGPPPSADGDRPLHRFEFDGASRVFQAA